MARASEMQPAARLAFWRGRFGRHCLERYVEGACPFATDPRGCGYLHGSDDDEDDDGEAITSPEGGAARDAAPAAGTRRSEREWLEEQLRAEEELVAG